MFATLSDYASKEYEQCDRNIDLAAEFHRIQECMDKYSKVNLGKVTENLESAKSSLVWNYYALMLLYVLAIVEFFAFSGYIAYKG